MGEFQPLIDLIPQLGVYAVILIGTMIGIYKIVNRMLDENSKREDKNSEILEKISENLKSVSDTSKEVAESNRLLTERLSFDINEIKNMLKDKE